MVVTTSAEPSAVQMASMVFKNALIRDNSSNWMQIDEQTREQIKQGLLSLLGMEDRQKVKAGSICVASVASIELP